MALLIFFFFSIRRRHTRYWRDWSSDVCSSDLGHALDPRQPLAQRVGVDVERARRVGDRAAPREVLLERVEQRGAALAVVLQQRLDRGPVAVAGRLLQPQVDEVLVRAELLVAERAAGRLQRTRDVRCAGGLAQRLAALGDPAAGGADA